MTELPPAVGEMPLLFFPGAWNISFAKFSLGLVIESAIDELSTIIKVDMHVEGKENTTQSDWKLLVSAAQARSTSARAV